ncbi:SH3 domain-containing protein [Pueribacillus theae]|uniref:SH3 domain-containing protein n=1 Tax=Pueribacillus theae TaxID=2171751 RepID=UPI00140238BB|nr:SH3 domain-containing protein [Pueribacillus theae]
MKEPTHIFESKSVESKSLKSYAKGVILQYQPEDANWYKAVVYLDGKPRKGYIYKNDVETSMKNQANLKGVALKKPTKIYKNASTQSTYWKSYPEGSILHYRTFSKNWYEATVYISGKARTGYVHKSHVEDAVNKQENLRGIGKINPTKVYKNASTSSGAWKSYEEGTVLQYRTFSKNWYEATVYVSGKARTGYIYKGDIEEALSVQTSLNGRALKQPTLVYSKASRNSMPLKSFGKHVNLKFKSFSDNWYEATVIIKGKPRTGYIHVDDVTTKDIVKVTNYNYSFEHMVNTQMKGKPKSDGAGLIPATRQEVEYYANPSNFPKGTIGYYQFLVLSEPVGLNAKEVNEKVLNQNGSLKGQAQAFIDAGREFGINEAYLIAHALHETGNGNSILANGVPVDKNGKVTRDENGNIAKTSRTYKVVYNMYGYGAYDSCPIDCGAEYAFKQGWFSKSASIIGGAGSIYNYIKRGQDTLYKMRWNPENPGYPQYATHVAWAELQTSKIAAIYNTLDNYTLVFDVPKFIAQPGPTEKPIRINFTRSLFSMPSLEGAHEFGDEPIELAPEEPSHPKEEVTPEEPSHPEVTPEEPSNPEEEVTPEEPSNPEEEVTPEEPSNPAGEVTPEEPANPEEEVTPEAPSNPEEEVTPEEPSNPEEEGTPEEPSNSEEAEEDSNTFPIGVYGVIHESINFRSSPSSKDDNNIIGKIPGESKLEIIDMNETWFKIQFDKKEGWVHREDVTLLNLIEVLNEGLHVYAEPYGEIVGELSDTLLAAVLDENDDIVRKDNWYQIYYNGKEAWICGAKDGQQSIKVK